MATGRFLTGAVAARGDAVAPVRQFVDENAALFGHDATALNDSRVTREDVTAHNGMRTVVWQQQVDGVPLYNTILKANLTKDGALVTLGSHFMADAVAATGMDAPARAALFAAPPVDVKKAISLAAADLGDEVAPEQAVATSAPLGAERKQTFTAPRLSDTFAQLSWLPVSAASARLTWDVTLMSRRRSEMFRVLVDARTGDVLMRTPLTADISDATYRVYADGTTKQPFDSPTPFSPGHSTPLSTQPAAVNRNLVTLQALDTTASPNGWINDGGTATFGNNVDAHLDTFDTDPTFGSGTHAVSATRVFDFTLDLTKDPTAYQSAAITQLFYACNWYHDKLYSLGFTESAGNFQQNNFSKGGFGNDAVLADVQDGGALFPPNTNNANFSTPPDGSPGRMQMYLFDGPTPHRDGDLDMEVVFHEYTHGLSNRLVGGGVGISALQSSGMGEGWSDFYALSLLSQPGDDVNGNYAAGGYVTYRLSGVTTNYYFGIRRYPYTTDMSKNPLTLKDIDPTKASPHTGIPLSPLYFASNDDPSEVHGQGEVWCAALWEVRASLVNKLGATPGNQMALQLATDGMKLSPADPTFLQARDAIIQADLVNNGGANRNDLWLAFAKRGMGFSAKVPNSSTTIGVVEAFDILPGDLNVTPLSTFSSKGRFGGPFAPSSQSYTLTNTGTSSLDWTASVDQTWLSVTPPSGTLAAGASTTVNVMLTPVASGLGGGSYTGATTFKNLTDGTLIRIQAVLTVAPPSTNADLASLAPKLDVINPTSIKLVPGFSSGTTDYGGRVSYTATSVTVTPTVADGGATVTVNGVPVGSGTPSKPIALTTGINHITTVVTAEDRVTTKTYRIAMTRPPSTDFYLSSLVPDVGSLSPPFENARFSYSNFVSFNTTSIRFTPTPSDGAATVTVNGAPATSGTASGPINLNPGANLITVAVTAADGVTTGTYTVTVIRPLPDTTAPMVALRKPPTATTIVGPAGGSIPTSGTASDNSVVASVQVSLNGGAFTNAMVTPGAKLTDPVAWSFSVKPENGPNNLMVRSMDAQGNKSATKAVNFRYLVLRPEFAGKYAGPAAPTGVSTNPARHVGISAITVTKTGQFTGSLKLGGSPAAIPLRATFGNGGDARFGADGASTVAINRPNLPSILLALHLDVLGGSQRITGTLTENGKGISDLTLDRLLYAALTNPVPSTLTGAYTGIFQALTPPNDTLAATDYPQGHGYALASVQTSGRVTVTGKLADGQAFSYANYLSQAKVVPLYLLPYAGTGTVSGLVKFQDLAGSDADGAGLRWFKPDNLPNFAYPKGWPNGIHVDFLGSKFLLPARRTPAHPSPPYVLGEDNILGLPAPSPVMLALIDGGITSTASIFKAATVDGKNKATITPPVDPLLNLKAAFPTDITTHVPTGKLSGSFTHPVSKKTVPFSGVVFQKLHTADGYFLGPPAADAPAGSLQSGAVTISPP